MKKGTLLAALLLALFGARGSAQKTYTNPVYGYDFPDPSVVRADDGYFYAYATGPRARRSKDLVTWTDVSGVISRPTWNDTTYVDASGTKKTDKYNFWACDVSKTVEGTYLMHYACALWGNGSRTGIGVATGTVPSKFTDVGRMFRSTEIGVNNSIDPCYVEEFDKKYLVWGSFNDIYIAELTDDGLAVKDFSKKTKIGGGAFEGAMIYKRGKYYYLFASIGSCCEGQNSTYKTVVGRSTKLTGPYTNRQGGRMYDNNYTTIISGNDRWRGPGHNSEIITDDEGQTWLLYHSYDMNNDCNGRLMLLDKITWDSSDWPVINDGHPSSDPQEAPVFYTGNGANITYKVRNADLSKSQWAGWTADISSDCVHGTGKGTAFMPFGYVRNGGTFDISQTITTNVSDGLYELRVNGFDTEHSVEYYVGKVATPVLCPADNGQTAPSADATIANNFQNNKFAQSVYGLVIGGKLTFGMRTRQPLSSSERFCVSNVRLIYRDKQANSDPTALASVLNSYYAQAADLAASGKPYYKVYDERIAAYREAAEGTDEATTRYQQLLKINRTVDSIQTSMETYADLTLEVETLNSKLAAAEQGGYATQEARDALAEGQRVLVSRDVEDRDIKTLVERLQTARHDMSYAYQTGDGTKEAPYIIVRPEQLDHMHDVLKQDEMVYFALGADVDMEGFDWQQLNTTSSGYRYRINFDGRGHIIHNLTPNGAKSYPSFFGTLCGEIRNTGFVDAKVEATASGAAVIGGALGHSTYKDADGNMLPVIIENCYVTGSVVSKGYVGGIGGTLSNCPVIIRNCYSAASITGNGTSANYSGGLVGRVRTNLTMEQCYAAAPVVSPVAGGIVAGGQNSTTPSSTYREVIAWNPCVDGASASAFGQTIESDILSGTYVFSEMTVNGAATDGGLNSNELRTIAGKWGSPWYRYAWAGNGYPILQWQYDRGDYREMCGFKYDPGTEISAPASSREDGAIFNLAGQRMEKPAAAGIYISGGRKILVR